MSTEVSSLVRVAPFLWRTALCKLWQQLTRVHFYCPTTFASGSLVITAKGHPISLTIQSSKWSPLLLLPRQQKSHLCEQIFPVLPDGHLHDGCPSLTSQVEAAGCSLWEIARLPLLVLTLVLIMRKYSEVASLWKERKAGPPSVLVAGCIENKDWNLPLFLFCFKKWETPFLRAYK